MRIDLHCHSTYSDGSLSAIEVAQRAKEQGVQWFCLTDHDSCEGYQETCSIFPDAIRGVELSCTEGGHTVHLLLYAQPKADWSSLETALVEQRRIRRARVHTIAARLAELGAVFDPDALLARCPAAVGRPHVAQELVRLGIVASRVEAFQRFLYDDGPGDVKVSKLTVADGLALAKEVESPVSLAHPHMYGDRTESLIQKHRDAGLTGIEVYYGMYNAKKRKKWAAVAKRYGLVATGGSDFHGPGVTAVKTFGVEVPAAEAEKLLRWLKVSA